MIRRIKKTAAVLLVFVPVIVTSAGAFAAPAADARIPVLAALHANIQDAFNEYGVQIMSPHYLGDPASSKTVPKERWYEAPAGDDRRGGSPKALRS